MDLVKIFKYIIAINILVVFLFFVFILIINFSQKNSEEKSVTSDNNSFQQEEAEIKEISVEEELTDELRGEGGESNNFLDKREEELILRNEFFLKTEEIDSCYSYEEEYLRNSCEKIALFKLVIKSGSSDICKIAKNKITEQGCVVYFDYIQFLKKESFKECVDFKNEKDEILCKQNIFPFSQFLTKIN